MTVTFRRLALAIVAALLALAPRPTLAELRALVVGIDDYRELTPLQGAVNDARDVADALQTAGATQVRLLLNGEATRDRFVASWRELAAGLRGGDVLFVSYAGHGGQDPARPDAVDEADKRDETLLFGGFAPRGAGTYERLRDDDLAALIGERPEVTVLFVSDSCHSGGVTRGGWGRVRASSYGSLLGDLLPPPPPAQPVERAQSNLAFMGAVQENELAPEVRLDGQQRGALSWSIARALRGAADLDADGVITRRELETYVRQSVRAVMDGRQHPQLLFGMDLEAPLIGARRPAPTMAATLPPLPEIGLAILPADAAEVASMAAKLSGVLAVEPSAAALIVDLRRGVVMNHLHDIVAHGTGDLNRLQAEIDKARLLAWIDGLGLDQPLGIETLPKDKVFAERETFDIRIQPIRYFSPTIVNMAPGGLIQFLYPLPPPGGDPVTVEPGQPILFAGVSEPPHGVNDVIAIATAEPLQVLHGALRELDGRSDPRALHRQLVTALTGKSFEIGTHRVFTGEPG